MAELLPGLLQALRSRRALRRWQRRVADGHGITPGQLAGLAPQAREVAEVARRLAEAADRRLLQRQIGAAPQERPPQCDWAWRATPWAAQMAPAAIAGVSGGTSLTEGVRLFHDCPLSEITLRQTRAGHPSAPAPFFLTMDALGFEGSFLSLAMDLPEDGATTLTRSHIVGVKTHIRMERPAEVFVRLNIRHGPNTEQMVSEATPGGDGPVTSEFDLGFQEFNPAKLEAAWIDLIFDKPAMNMVRIDDVVVTRRPRADL